MFLEKSINTKKAETQFYMVGHTDRYCRLRLCHTAAPTIGSTSDNVDAKASVHGASLAEIFPRASSRRWKLKRNKTQTLAQYVHTN